METVSGASEKEINYWGTKAAGFAFIGAVALFVALIPAKNWWANSAPLATGAVAAVFSGYYWLEDASSGNAGGYIFIVGALGIPIAICVLVGPAVAYFEDRKSGNTNS